MNLTPKPFAPTLDGEVVLSILQKTGRGNRPTPRQSRFSSARLDSGDLDDRQILLVASLALRILAPALFEGDDLRPARLLDDLAYDARPGYVRGADLVGRPVEQREHLVEHHLRSGFARQGHDRDLLIGGDRVLLAACLDDCEHRFSRVLPGSLRKRLCAAGFFAVDRIAARERAAGETLGIDAAKRGAQNQKRGFGSRAGANVAISASRVLSQPRFRTGFAFL